MSNQLSETHKIKSLMKDQGKTTLIPALVLARTRPDGLRWAARGAVRLPCVPARSVDSSLRMRPVAGLW